MYYLWIYKLYNIACDRILAKLHSLLCYEYFFSLTMTIPCAPRSISRRGEGGGRGGGGGANDGGGGGGQDH